MKYFDCATVFQEIPDEISLAINITNCPHNCLNCHSPYLREDIGTELTKDTLDEMLRNHKHVTCVLFMGGDRYHDEIGKWTSYIHHQYGLKVGMYSGDDEVDNKLLNHLEYYKVGSYQEDKGPLSKETTNQRLYKQDHGVITDITSRFWKKTL